MKNFFYILCLAISVSTVQAANYYVANSGNNTQDGTEGRPWKTISYAISKVVPGDVVFVQAGNYSEVVNITVSGTSTAPITFKGIGNPVIGTGNNNVRVTGNFIEFDGFTISNTSSNGVVMNGSNNKLVNCTVHNNLFSGIEITGSNNKLENCIVHTNTSIGVILSKANNSPSVNNTIITGGKIYDNKIGLLLNTKATNLLLDTIEFYSTGGSTGKQETAIKCWNGGGTTNFTMKKLHIHDHPGYGAEIMPSSSAYMNDVFMTDCHFDNNGIGAPFTIPQSTTRFRPANLLIQRVVNGTLERNIFERGKGWGVDIYTSRNYKVFNNLFLNNFDDQTDPVGPGFALEVNASDDTFVYNNTFYGNKTAILISYLNSGHDWPPGQFDVTLRNNLVFKSTGRDYQELLDVYAGQTKIVLENNVLSTTGRQSTDPLFVNIAAKDFHLTSASPFINKGVTVPVPDDYAGVTRPQGINYDMGMYEYCAGTCTTVIGPSGYGYVAAENQTITASITPKDVAYGADGNYVYLLDQKTNIGCDVTTFGSDPKPGAEKYCFAKESKVPYNGTASLVPGTIEMEHYDYGGQGVSYNDNEPTNRGNLFRLESGVDIDRGINGLGFAIGFTITGEWQKYTIDIAETGEYDFLFYASSASGGGKLKLSLESGVLAEEIVVPSTGSWTVYRPFSQKINLTKGKNVLKVEIAKSGFNLDKIEISSTLSSGNDLVYNENEIIVYPNPSSTGIFNFNKELSYSVYNVLGKLIAIGNGNQLDLSSFPNGTYILKTGSVSIKLLK